jgi:hypothetical protein
MGDADPEPAVDEDIVDPLRAQLLDAAGLPYRPQIRHWPVASAGVRLSTFAVPMGAGEIAVERRKQLPTCFVERPSSSTRSVSRCSSRVGGRRVSLP